MIRVLITGFEAFGGMPVNPSQVLVDSISQVSFETNFPITITTKILPVNFKESGQNLFDFIIEYQPDVLIATGVDLSKYNIELERVAHKNPQYLTPSLLGLIAPNIDLNNLPDNYYSAIDLDFVLSKIQQQNVNAIVSDDTGMYVCNHVYYLANLMNEYTDLSIKSFFVHVPYPYPYWIGENHIIPDYSIKEIQEGFLKILAAVIELFIDKKTVS